jgi:hypothetical protein
MQIKKNQVLILHRGPLIGDVEQYDGIPAYRSLIQEDPFIEVHFIQPVPVKKLNRGRMTFTCEEVGVYTERSTQKTWTIGKKCKLR